MNYIKQLPPGENGPVGTVDWYGDGTGRHALDIKINVNGSWRDHLLIYDRENKRVKVIKFQNEAKS